MCSSQEHIKNLDNELVVWQKQAALLDFTYFLLMHAMGPNVAGVIGTAVAAGVLLTLFK